MCYVKLLAVSNECNVVTEWLQRFLELAQFLEACPCSGSVHLPSSTRASKYFSTVALSILSLSGSTAETDPQNQHLSPKLLERKQSVFQHELDKACVRCNMAHSMNGTL